MTKRFFILLTLILSPHLVAQTNFAALLAAASVGLVNGTPTGLLDFPGVMKLKQWSGDRRFPREASACSGIAVGACYITATHCFAEVMENAIVHSVTGEEVTVDRSSIVNANALRPHVKDDNLMIGDDIMVVHLDKTPTAAFGIEILDPAPETVPKWKTAETLDDLAKYAPSLIVVAFGLTFDPVAMAERFTTADYTLKLSVLLGTVVRRQYEHTHDYQQLGDLKLLGYAHDVLWRPDLEFYDQEIGKSPADTAAKMQQRKDELLRDQTLVMLPSPTIVESGDSGSPVFVKVGNRLYLYAITSATHRGGEYIEPPLSLENYKVSTAIKKAHLDPILKRRPGFASSIEKHRVWLQKKIEDLNCFPKHAAVIHPAAKLKPATGKS